MKLLKPRFPLTAKLNKLTLNVDRQKPTPDDIKRLHDVMQNVETGKEGRSQPLQPRHDHKVGVTTLSGNESP